MTPRTATSLFVVAPLVLFALGFLLANAGDPSDAQVSPRAALPPEATCRQVRDARAAAAVAAAAAAAAASSTSGGGYGRGTGGYSGGGGWSGGK